MSTSRTPAMENLIEVISALMRGEPQTWRTIAATCSVGRAAADRRLHLIRKLPGVRASQDKRSRTLNLAFDRPIADRVRLPVVYAACIASSLSQVLKGTAHEQNLREARALLFGRVGMEVPFDVDRKFVFVSRGGEHGFPELAENLDDLVQALLDSRRLTFKYRPQHRAPARTVEVEPLSLAIYQHQFYLVGREIRGRRSQDGPYPFRFARMSGVELGAAFTYPQKSHYDPEQLLRHSIGIFVTANYPISDVVIQVSPDWARYAETHRWHSTQRVERRAGKTLLRMTVRLCPELQEWILSLGEGATVLEPASLRLQVRERLIAAVGNYGPPLRKALKGSVGPGLKSARAARRPRTQRSRSQTSGSRPG